MYVYSFKSADRMSEVFMWEVPPIEFIKNRLKVDIKQILKYKILIEWTNISENNKKASSGSPPNVVNSKYAK